MGSERFIVVAISPRRFVVAEGKIDDVYEPITKATPRRSEAKQWRDEIRTADVRDYSPVLRAVLLD